MKPHATAIEDEEIARLEALRRLAMGAAHSLNNAFTSVLGEASFLLEDRKDDPQLVESCQAIVAAVDRCTRITRGLLERRAPGQSDDDEIDLGRLAGVLVALLRETLGSRHHIELVRPDDLLLARGAPRQLELALLLLLQYAADHAGGPARLRLELAHRPEGGATVELRVQAPALPEYAADALRDASLAPDPLTRTSLRALSEILDALGAARHVERLGPDVWAMRVGLAAPD